MRRTDAKRKPVCCDCTDCERGFDPFYLVVAGVSLLVSLAVVLVALVVGVWG